ncbi:MAG: AAA family ATPase [Minwuia sp.]|nr:AAA family ATPase [Minwuia sp.]
MNTPEPDQAATVAFMMQADTHGGETVEHIETHISHIFLAGDYAWKMKKAVGLDFVDFSTLAQRKAACEAELVVNARTARAMYLDVVAVNARDGQLWLGPPTAPVEYLVWMHRFEQADLLDRMAAEHRLDLQTVREFADAVAGLHLTAEVVCPRTGLDAFGETLDDLISNLDHAVPDRLRAAFGRWRAKVLPVAGALAPRLAARARRGAVRHGHGDLHLNNACRFRGEVVLFDAIEFEPRFSHVDVLYDAAFALMDLRHRGEDEPAIVFLSRYLVATRDYADMPALRLFLSVRAAVRALVGVLSPAGQTGAAEYLMLAEDLLTAPRPPRVIAIGGRSGTGKSTLAQALAPRIAHAPDVVILRTDEIRKRMLGCRPDETLGAEAYRSEVTVAVYRRLAHDAGRALGAGVSVILDATMLKPEQRAIAQSIARDSGVAFHGFWLVGAEETLAERIAGRGTDASDADQQVMRRQPKIDEVAGWQTLRSDRDRSATLEAALALLGLPA